MNPSTQSKLVLRQGYIPRSIANKALKFKKMNRITWNELFTQGLILVLDKGAAHVSKPISRSEQKRLAILKKIYHERNTAWPYAVYQGNKKLGSYRTLEMLKSKHPDAVSKKK